jgi:hypothetical protein
LRTFDELKNLVRHLWSMEFPFDPADYMQFILLHLRWHQTFHRYAPSDHFHIFFFE